MPLGRDARLGASYAGQGKPPLLVLVLGETGRSGNFGLNGYGRPTTPELSARNDLVSARNAWSCGTSTAASVPCMFSNLGRTAYEASHIRSRGCWTCCSMPAWPCCGWTTSRAARACATA